MEKREKKRKKNLSLSSKSSYFFNKALTDNLISQTAVLAALLATKSKNFKNNSQKNDEK